MCVFPRVWPSPPCSEHRSLHVFHTLFGCAVAMTAVNAAVDTAIVLCEEKPVNDALLTFEKLYSKHNQDSFV